MSDARARNRASGKATFFVILNCPMIDWSLRQLAPLQSCPDRVGSSLGNWRFVGMVIA